MKNIAIGVIGAGLIGRKHLRKIGEHHDYDLVGIADVNVDAVSAEYPKTRVFADYRKLLDEARPQGVIIATPNQLHAETGIECARRGIHILIEKPVTDTLQTASALMAEVRKGGIKSLVGHHRRHHLQVRTLKALLGEGRIGDVVGVSAIWATHKPADYFKVAPWRTEPGGGPILINLIHDIDMLRFIAGEIVGVTAFTASAARGFPVEDTAAIALRFASGALGTLAISDSAAAPWSWELTSGEDKAYPTFEAGRKQASALQCDHGTPPSRPRCRPSRLTLRFRRRPRLG
jgi:predicted dehydrogenase